MNRRPTTFFLAAAGAAALAFTAADVQPARAQSQAWVQQLRGQVDKATPMMQQRGYSVGTQGHTGLIAQGASERFDIDLVGGPLYQLIGFCDNDCSDIDLKIYDSSGKLVDSDVQVDDYPVVSVRPPASGRYSVEVSMAKCRVSTCGYIVQSYSKIGGGSTTASTPPPAASTGSGIDISALVDRSLPVLHAGQTVQGTLGPSSVLRNDDSYMNGYLYNGVAGEKITITLRSPDFDSWLVIDQPDGPFRQWDDDSAGGNDSRLSVTIPTTGRYIIVANSVQKRTSGRYTLSVDKAQ